MNNYAFIDSQNVNLSIRELGWILDWRKFRVYLKEKYKVERAYMFLGYLSENEGLYKFLRESGYVLVFKEVLNIKGVIKGNIDAELVLQAMIDFDNYDKAVVITNDGDFACLIRYLHDKMKFSCILSPNIQRCSALLQKSANGKIYCMSFLRAKIGIKK